LELDDLLYTTTVNRTPGKVKVKQRTELYRFKANNRTRLDSAFSYTFFAPNLSLVQHKKELHDNTGTYIYDKECKWN